MAATSWKATRAAKSQRANDLSHYLAHVGIQLETSVGWMSAYSDVGAGARGHVLHARRTPRFLYAAYWDEYGPGAAGVGWELSFLGLAIHLAKPTEPMPEENSFPVSPDGRAFIAGSSEGWAQAAVATGTAPDDAHAAARRTTAFYTGESAEPA